MKKEQLKNPDNYCVTVRFEDISLSKSTKLSKDFRATSKSNGLYIGQPTHLDSLRFTDLFFWVSEPPENWEETFIESLEKVTQDMGWEIDDNDSGITIKSP